MKKLTLSLVLMVFTVTSASSNIHAAVFNAESFMLDNGMKIVVVPNHRAPVVSHMVWYGVGAADEPQGFSGMAHYFEHLMFKGTKKLKPGEFSRIVKALGGRDNAFTGQDYTAYFQTIAVEHLERMMEMEADRMANLDVPPEHFASEKKVVLEERRQRTENDPRSLFFEQMKSALFVNHPYGTPIIGWMDEIEKYEWNDVKVFYDTWYAPNNATVIISGDTTAEEVKPIAMRTYGKLKPKDLPPRKRSNVPPSSGETEMILKHKNIHQPLYTEVFITPAATEDKKADLALQVLQEILSSGSTTRLYKNLVVEKKKAISASFSYRGDALDYGTIWLSSKPAKGVSLEELKALIHVEIKDIIENGVTDKEVSDAIQRLQDGAIFARDSLQGPAMTFGFALAIGKTIDDIENWPENIGRITPDDVQKAAATYLDPENPWHRESITGYLLPLDDKIEGKE
jgi:zinc protease